MACSDYGGGSRGGRGGPRGRAAALVLHAGPRLAGAARRTAVLVGLETGGQVTLMPSEITTLPRPSPRARRQRGDQRPHDATRSESASGGAGTAGWPSGPDRVEPGPVVQEPSHDADDVSEDVAALEDA